MSDTHTIAHVVGRTKMATHLDVGEKMISKAVTSGRFPPSWWFVMKSLCHEAGVQCPPDLFGFKELKKDLSRSINRAIDNPCTGNEVSHG